MTSEEPESPETPQTDLSPEELYQGLEVMEPYTAGELASRFEVSRRHIRTLLDRLREAGKIRKKEPEPKRAIWIRDAPIQECSNCEYSYEVKFLHPVLSTVHYCPRCGTQL
jgi:DNA-binding transcriptional ArsR family regulator